ncbi:sigma-70 family RNA polymerase sigma factor [Sedimentibacter sp.]|uniref:RNA polymerase sigma factor n=1 Tax=Sedimentibacter sp. TaxID=1960295 RepID=UPI00289F269D|nr:sigma-70 family RNA polymerase sigma factor [Sedimentibacter sp.]
MGRDKKAFIYDERAKQFILEVYDKYREGMLRLAYSKLNDWHDAEDAVEESFINIARNYEKIIYSKDCEIKKYIVRTVTNTSYKIIDKKSRIDCSDADIIEKYLPLVDSAEEIALSDISYDKLKYSVDKLNPRFKIVLNMKYMGYSNKEIAEELDVNADTIRVMLFRIRAALKKSKKEGNLNEEGHK